ncbi:MAG: hypothetical protein EPO24_01585 [Bacteroidetes bacterium]|nr:MAG: hypothetical protein EPO24_01585 [Bacteroidota bacterium]
MSNNLQATNEFSAPNISESSISKEQSQVKLLPSIKSMTETALTYVKNGLSVIPIKKDKQPSVKWKPFQENLPQTGEITSWWNGKNYSMAIVCGKVSNNLEVLDFDEKYNIEATSIFTQWQSLVQKEQPGLIDKLPVQQTMNHGYHVFYSCSEIQGNQKLALREATADELKAESEEKSKTLIETRGEGGYVLCYPSPGYAICNRDLLSVPQISPEEREILLSCAKALTRFIGKKDLILKKNGGSKRNRPGDMFNAKADHKELLTKHGWKYVDEDEKNERWRRPGKKEGISATLLKDKKYFYVFSSNAPNLQPEKSYDLFSLYTHLESGGDYSLAAKKLAELGYGELHSKQEYDKIEQYLNDMYEFRLNVITDRLELRADDKEVYKPLTDYELNSIARDLHKQNMTIGIDALNRLLHSDFIEKYDPFTSYFNALPEWDQTTNYISQLASSVELAEQADTMTFADCLKRWLIGMTGCAVDPDTINHTAIIFVGRQGVGKSRWLNRLVPESLTNYKFIGTINPDNKDSLIYLAECLLINLDELETLRKSEIGALKTLMTLPKVKVRRPYERLTDDLVRRVSFVGSINQTEFLNDTTGSRRFLTFEVKSFDFSKIPNIDFVMSQAYTLYKSGERHWFDDAEIQSINDHNKRYMTISYEEELLCQYTLLSPSNGSSEWMTATAIANRLKLRDMSFQIKDSTYKNLGSALTKIGYRSKKSNGKKLYEIGWV